MPEIIMPWCSSGSIMLSRVDSCPPCRPPPLAKTVAGLPIKWPESQCGMVPSRKYLTAAAMLPKRTGLPKASPAQFFSSSGVQ